MPLALRSSGPLLLLLAGCAPEVEPAAAPLPAASTPVGPGPAWPTVIPEAPAPPGYSWQTLRRETVHARLLVPDDAFVTESDAGEKTPFVRIQHRAVTADVTFSPGSTWSVVAQGPAAQDNIAGQTELPGGGVRVYGYARGAQCVVDLGPFDRGATEEAVTICSSLRPPPPGPWQPAVSKPAGTAIPTGAWVEPSRASMVGDSLLGPYAPRLYTGWFGLAHTNCPADYATLDLVVEGESEVVVARRDSAGGPAYVRRARAVKGGVPFASGARVVAPRGAGCCVAELFPFLTAPSDAEVDYVVALCDTTGSASTNR